MQRFRIKVKLEYKIEKSSLNSKQKGRYKVKRKGKEAWCRRHKVQTGDLAREAEIGEETTIQNYF